jgi:hypothetical protein
VFLGFGALKFVPGASSAQELAERTLEKLSLGIVSGETALLVTAVAECFIGVTLVTGKLLRAGLIVLAASMVGILSPLVLFFHDLFPGAPTLEGQYVLKDFVLVAAGLVIAAQALGPNTTPRPVTRCPCPRSVTFLARVRLDPLARGPYRPPIATATDLSEASLAASTRLPVLRGVSSATGGNRPRAAAIALPVAGLEGRRLRRSPRCCGRCKGC